MNFTYSFTDDPINEQLVGNITWKIPSPELPAHWVHAEYPCKQKFSIRFSNILGYWCLFEFFFLKPMQIENFNKLKIYHNVYDYKILIKLLNFA